MHTGIIDVNYLELSALRSRCSKKVTDDVPSCYRCPDHECCGLLTTIGSKLPHEWSDEEIREIVKDNEPELKASDVINYLCKKLKATHSYSNKYPFARELEEAWQVEYGSELSEDGKLELLTYEEAFRGAFIEETKDA